VFRFEDVLDYKEAIDTERRKVLAELAAEAQELGMGYWALGTFTAFLDASVLYPAPLRDVLLELAVSDLYRAKWSNSVHDEWINALLRSRDDLTNERLERTRWPRVLLAYLKIFVSISGR
jgi:hypothetical protein